MNISTGAELIRRIAYASSKRPLTDKQRLNLIASIDFETR